MARRGRRRRTLEQRENMSRAAKKRVARLKGKFRICEQHGRVPVTAWGAHIRYEHGTKRASSKMTAVLDKPQKMAVKDLDAAIMVGVTQSDVILKTEGREIPIAMFMHGGSAEDLARLLRSVFQGKPPQVNGAR